MREFPVDPGPRGALLLAGTLFHARAAGPRGHEDRYHRPGRTATTGPREIRSLDEQAGDVQDGRHRNPVRRVGADQAGSRAPWPFILEDRRGRRDAARSIESPGRRGRGPPGIEQVALELVDIIDIGRSGGASRSASRLPGPGSPCKGPRSTRRLDLAADLGYYSHSGRLRSDASSYFTSQENVQDIKKNNLSFDVMRLYKKRWTAAGFAKLEQNTELNLDLRVLAGAGIGRYFLRTNRNVLSAMAALDVTRENYIDGTESKTNMEAVLGANFDAFRYWFPNMSLTSSLYAYPSLTEKGRVRVGFQMNIRYEVFRRFYVSLGFMDSYDSKPGGETTTKNDYSLTFGISWSLT